MSNYECALSGVESEPGIADESDGLGDLPVGWTKITWSRRGYNPRWLQIQGIKDMKLKAVLSQIPPEAQEMQEQVIRLQLDAEFFGLENATPMYLSEDEEVFISDSGDVVSTLNEIRTQLGMAELTFDEEEIEKELDSAKEAT